MNSKDRICPHCGAIVHDMKMTEPPDQSRVMEMDLQKQCPGAKVIRWNPWLDDARVALVMDAEPDDVVVRLTGRGTSPQGEVYAVEERDDGKWRVWVSFGLAELEEFVWHPRTYANSRKTSWQLHDEANAAERRAEVANRYARSPDSWAPASLRELVDKAGGDVRQALEIDREGV